MRTHHRINVTLTLLGPILTRGGRMTEPAIDAPIARDGLGRPMLPFSLIKGKIVDAFRDLGPESGADDGHPVADWLGQGSRSDLEPERGRLRFSDFITETPGQTFDNVIERVQIESESRTVAGQMLAMIEAPFGYGQPVPFRGTVEFIADEAEAEQIQDALEQAFRWVPSYGALRTVGFGRTHHVDAVRESGPSRSRGKPDRSATVLPLRLRFDRPLCLVGRKHSGNHFESLQSVPGAALKGALARLILELTEPGERFIDPTRTNARWPHLCANFEKLRVAEARPMEAGASHRPVEPPLSIVTVPVRPDQYFDAALEPEARLIDGAAPVFLPDWKGADFGLVRGAFGWSEIATERRTRTAIDESKGKALEGNLFSYDLVLPEFRRDDGRVQSVVWETSIGVEGIEASERGTVIEELADLLVHGLPNVGKTRAVADCEWLEDATPGKVPQIDHNRSEHIITLQTGFLMTDPRSLRGNSADALERAYEDFWREISHGALELVRYFARQTLHGGFLAKRRRPGRYRPFLLTEPGSTFVLKTIDPEKTDDLLKTWRLSGLTVPSWVRGNQEDQSASLWKTCPFLPEAGFGEVAIDLECHFLNRFPEDRR